MAGYIVTGKLGAGKTLGTVARIRDGLKAKKRVASNLDLRIENLLSRKNRTAEVFRIPDKPLIEDLENLPPGNKDIYFSYDHEGNVQSHMSKGFDESNNGMLVLDEAGTWFNTRSWNDKSRHAVVDWFRHARKFGWDVYFIIQDIESLDKQARGSLAEYVVECRRMDKVGIPLISSLSKALTGYRVTWPRFHLAIVKYSDAGRGGLTVDKWLYRGSDLYDSYDTTQVFADVNNGLYQYLTPWHVKGRFTPPPLLDQWKAKIKSNYGWIQTAIVVALICGFFYAYDLNSTLAHQQNISDELKEDLKKTNVRLQAYRERSEGETTSLVGRTWTAEELAVEEAVESDEGNQEITEIAALDDCEIVDGWHIKGSLRANGEDVFLIKTPTGVLSSLALGDYFEFEKYGRCVVRVKTDTCSKVLTCDAGTGGARQRGPSSEGTGQTREKETSL